ncbi:MAG: heavy-metal-associated domain-containing protein [Pseudonocardiaceae bacterium]
MADPMTEMNVQVDAMTCTGCEQRIGTALRRIEGVHDVVADHATGGVRVRFDPEVTVTDAVTERITLAGFTVRDAGGGAR